MTDLPDIVNRARSLPGAIASDLSLFGGVLRCNDCKHQEPVGDIASHLRHGWPKHCGHTMAWVTLKELAAEQWEVPDDCDLVAVAAENWRRLGGKPCVRRVGRAVCHRGSVAELNRGQRRWSNADNGYRYIDAWHPYCLDHLYGNWIQDGKVWQWILRGKSGA